MQQGILEYPQFWVRWVCRLVGEVGLGILAFSSCVEMYEAWPSPLSVALMALVCALPVEIGLCFRCGFGQIRRALAVLTLAFVVAYELPLGWGRAFLLLFLGALAEMLQIATDDELDRRITPLHAAARRVKDARIYGIGLLAPALSALMLSHATFEFALRVGGAMFGLSLLYPIFAFHKGEAPAQMPEQAAPAGRLTRDVALSSIILNAVISMTVGALLIPMMLSRTSVDVLAAAIACFFAGLIMGSIFDPLRHFYDSDRKAFSKNSAILLLVQVLLFGMARQAWQWNLLAIAGGVLTATAWGNLVSMNIAGLPKLKRMNGAARLAGLALGMLTGATLEFIVGRSPLIAEFCARLTGQGEGSGYAMTFVLAGFVGAFALDYAARRIRRSETEE